MSKKKWRLNLFDIIIVIIIIAVAGGLYVFTHKDTVVETKVLRYQVELTECPLGLSEKISVGDKLTDNVKNYYMGKVAAVEANPCKKLGEDRENGQIRESIVPEVENIIITVEANVTESASDLRVDGNYVVKGGKEVSVKGKGYGGKGYIITVER